MLSQATSCSETSFTKNANGASTPRKLAHNSLTLGETNEKLAAFERSRLRLKAANERLKRENARLSHELIERGNRIEELLHEKSRHTLQADALEQENTSLLNELENCLQHIEQLETERRQDIARMAELEEHLAQSRQNDNCATFLDVDGCDAGCPAWLGCQRRVLIVGGIERMESRYRQLVEKEGGTLDYHSGNMQGGVKKLERCLQRADIVLCPVNCNSHGACLMVKKLGKKHNKPVHMMANFSLRAITRAISSEPCA